MQGFFNIILVIDLASQTWRDEPIADEVYQNYLGGKGLATRLLLRDNPPRVDPLSPANRLIFAVGPATDIKAHGSARYGVFTKSPLTGLYTESYSGGTTADRISRTGYDAVVLAGASPEPVMLEISDRGVVFHPAHDLWGKDVYETEELALKKVGKPGAAAAVIGPAGEKMARFAIIANNKWRCAGRTGAGAVMGNKKVKAIVFHGDKRREPADPALLAAHWNTMVERSRNNAGVAAYKKYGTTLMVKLTNEAGAFPTRYWSAGIRADWKEEISGDALLSKCRVRPSACPRCFMACTNRTEVVHGRHRGLVIDGPEYETIYAFGGLCLIKEIEEIIYLNHLCDKLGIDTITAGNLIGFAMHASEKGAIPDQLPFGDADAAADLVQKIAAQEGIGAVLAQGIVHAAREWGLEDDAVHVKGLEPAGFDPRALKGMGLAYAVSDRGACHLRATIYKPELSGTAPPDQVEGKAGLFLDFEDRATLFDTLILCRFFRDMILWDDLAVLIRAATGMDLDKAGLRRIASNVVDLSRAFNLREGATAGQDMLPKRLLGSKLRNSGKEISREEVQRMVSEYYRLRGWDENGVPPAYKEITG
ncbi:MAG TPA: aldehyde ferredoxin oxidoreductase family protein [bacterium]|nr:aldehyde ferredoxin oxidoreductase family protein [bacterium]